jgi:hypothetical protein
VFRNYSYNGRLEPGIDSYAVALIKRVKWNVCNHYLEMFDLFVGGHLLALDALQMTTFIQLVTGPATRDLDDQGDFNHESRSAAPCSESRPLEISSHALKQGMTTNMTRAPRHAYAYTRFRKG